MSKASDFLRTIGADPKALAAVAELTDQDLLNKQGIEDQIDLLDKILKKINKERDFRIQGMANIGILKLGLG